MRIRIKAKPIYYYGYLQGFKVWINGKKYPREHGHWYTAMKEEDATKRARSAYAGDIHTRLYTAF